MVGFTLLSRSYYYLRRRSPGLPFPPDHRQAGERGLPRVIDAPHLFSDPMPRYGRFFGNGIAPKQHDGASATL